MSINRWVASVTAATIIVGGGLTAAAVGLPNLVGAQEETPTTTAPAASPDRGGRWHDLLGGWLDEADGPLGVVLDRLVAEGTLTEAQADAVRDGVAAEAEARRDAKRDQLTDARDEVMATLGDALGLPPGEVADALAGGATIGELIEQQGLDRQAVVDELTAAAVARLEEAVASGDVPEVLADRIEEHVGEVVDRIVDEDLPWGLLNMVQGGLGAGHGRGLFGPGPGR